MKSQGLPIGPQPCGGRQIRHFAREAHRCAMCVLLGGHQVGWLVVKTGGGLVKFRSWKTIVLYIYIYMCKYIENVSKI